MRNLLLLLFIGISVSVSCEFTSQRNTQPPNILWIIAEDLSPDLGCYGHPLVQTPNIDALAAKGVRFTQVFTTAPVCSPSRTALGTGMYQTSLNAHHMRYPDELKNELPEHVIPLTELMRRQGYQTANIRDAPGRGKTDWSFKSKLAHYDVQNWDSLSNGKPFFSVVNLRLTHRPFERDPLNPIDLADVELPPYYPDHDVSRKDWAQYLETTQVLDRQVGQVLGELEKRNFSQNTIVFFFSDHGRPMSRAKNYHYDSGTHIPLVIYAPDALVWKKFLPTGTVNDNLISAIDLSATALAISGAKKPVWMQGRVLFGDQKESVREYVFCASDRIGETFFKTRSLRSKKYKYIRNYNRDFSINSSATAYRKQMHPIYHLLNMWKEKGLLNEAQRALVEPMPEELLFDLASDPWEINNLVGDSGHETVLQSMREQLDAWQQRTRDYGMEKDSEAIVQAFEDYRIASKSRDLKIKALEYLVRTEILKRN